MSVSNINNAISGGVAKSQANTPAVAAQSKQRASQETAAAQQATGPASRVTISDAARSRVAGESASSTAVMSSQQSSQANATATALKFLSSLNSAAGQASTGDRATRLQAGLGALQRTSQANEAVLSHFAS